MAVVALPIDSVLSDVLQAVRRHRRVVVQAPPGAGKTTRLPLALLDAKLCSPSHRLVMLEPRRIAARNAALTMARMRNEGVGDSVGYIVRHERKLSARTSVLVVTEGILTRRLVNDPLLDGVGIVVLDEFHERSLHTDAALAFVRELLEVRDDLAVVVMSATLDAQGVAAYLGDCPVVTSEGRMFPVDVSYVGADDRPVGVRMAGAVRDVWAKGSRSGDVLCFLPGVFDIHQCMERLQQQPLQGQPDVVALHGQLSPAEQDSALSTTDAAKIILATNVAETSVTLPKVTTVIDGGLVREASFDTTTEEELLRTLRVSRASAVQRAGRAGRVQAGACVRLYSEAQFNGLAASSSAEITRVDLSRLLLDVLSFHPGDPRAFPFFEAPPDARLRHALTLLQQLGAVDHTYRVTPLGKRLHAVPLAPRLASCLLAVQGASADVREDTARALAVLQDDRIRARGDARNSGASDLDELLQNTHGNAAREVDKTAQELLRVVENDDDTVRAADGHPAGDVAEALLRGFPDRVCVRRKVGAAEARMVGGKGVTLLRESVVRDAGLFLALSLRAHQGATGVPVAVAIDETLLKGTYPADCRDHAGARFDDARELVVASKLRTYRDVVLDARDGGTLSDDVALPVLLAACVERRAAVLAAMARDDEAMAWRWRVQLLRKHRPDDDRFPDVSDDAIMDRLAEVLLGKRRVQEVLDTNFHPWLQSWLPYAVDQELQRLVPTHVEVPTGNRIRIDYAPTSRGDPPVLAVRLQELFGLADGPQVLGAPIVLHLLSPGHKPVQVTTDLKSFWNRTYPEVKKELRVRYPKHSWPDDPWTAVPTDRARRRVT
jgi:ATP-dependent helicase HrpB